MPPAPPALVDPAGQLTPAPAPAGGELLGPHEFAVMVTRSAPREPVEGEVLPPADPHELRRTEYPGHGVLRSCACGRWEAITTGPASAAWATRDHERHLAEVRVAGDA